MKHKLIFQSRAAECGLACATMILRHRGIPVTLAQLRSRYPVGRDGMSSSEIRMALLDYGVSSKQKEGGIHKIDEHIKSGAQVLVHINKNHFCLVENINRSSVILADPSRGTVRYSLDESKRIFGPVWWVIPPTPRNQYFARLKITLSDLLISPTLRIFAEAIKQRKWMLFATVVLSFFLLAFTAIVPFVISSLVDSFGESEILNSTIIVLFLTAGFFCYAIMLIWRAALQSLFMKYSSEVLSERSIKKILECKLDTFSTYAPGELMYSLSSVTLVTSGIFTGLGSVIFNSLIAITLIISVAFLWNTIALILIVISLFLGIVFYFTTDKINRYSGIEAAAGGMLSKRQLEIIASIVPIRMCNVSGEFFKSWSRTNKSYLHATMMRTVWTSVGSALTSAFIIFAPIFPVAFGLIFPDLVSSFGPVVASSGVFSMFIASLSKILVGVTGLASVRASINRVDELISLEQERRGNVDISDAHSIEFDNVSYSYPGSTIKTLESVDFTINPRSSTTITGRSGGGKSTLIMLLTGLFEPDSGSVKIGGVSSFELTSKSKAQIFGFASQDSFLISGTIRENIAFGRNITDAAIWAALEKTMLADHVRKLPLGLSTQVGEMGTSFSGGQRQRIALCRAIVNKPKILVLDEATSAIDVPTERIIVENLRNENITLINVAHRPTSAKKDDRFISIVHNGVVTKTDPLFFGEMMKNE